MKTPVLVAALGVVVCAAGAPAQAQQDASSAITSKMQLNDVLGMELSNGCHYVATIKGDVTPATSGASKAKSGTVDADLTVDTSLACPKKALVHATQMVHEHGPLTKAELERALERGGSIVSDASGKTCLYRPELVFVSGKLTSGRVVLTCPPPQEQK